MIDRNARLRGIWGLSFYDSLSHWGIWGLARRLYPARLGWYCPAPMFVFPVGGCGEFGRNLTAYVCKQTLIVVDCGIQMPDDLSPGVDHFVSDLTELKQRFGQPRAVFLSHGHEDHIGAVYHLLRFFDAPIPVYGRPLSLGLCQKRLRRVGLAQRLFDPRPIVPRQVVHVPFSIDQTRDPDDEGLAVVPLAVSHSVPDSCALLICGPVRRSDLAVSPNSPASPVPTGVALLARSAPPNLRCVLHTGDFKLADLESGFPQPLDWPSVDLLVGDSTNALWPGVAGDERQVADALFQVLRLRPGRVAITLFSSHIERIAHIAQSCQKLGRRLCVLGRGLTEAIEAAENVGALSLPSELLCSLDEAAKLPGQQLALLCTGTQAEPVAALAKLVACTPTDSPPLYGSLRLRPGDTVVLSARAIPGNERPIARLCDRLIAHGIEVLSGFPYTVSGHGYQEDLAHLLRCVAPRAVLPVHGGLQQLAAHADLAEKLGIPAIRAQNGDLLEITEDQIRVVERLPCPALAVDGNTVGQVGFATLHQRRLLAQTGLVLVALGFAHPRRFQVRTVGLCDPGPFLDNLCRRAAQVADDCLPPEHTPLAAVDELAQEQVIVRAVRGVFRAVLGKKPLVVCLLGQAQSGVLDVQTVAALP